MMMIIITSLFISLPLTSLLPPYLMSFSMIPIILLSSALSPSISFNQIFFVYHHPIMSSYLDTFSFLLFMISMWLLLPMMNSMLPFKNSMKSFYMKSTLLFFILLFVSVTFLTPISLLFFMAFEATILPTVMLIIIWGYQPERLNAFLYMMFYTIIASLPLILSILSMSKFSSLLLTIPYYLNHPLLYLMSTIAFLVKIPLYSLHMWLPKAHVEAPVEGSMILAGILLKLGAYGLIRFMALNKMMIINYLIMIMGVVGAAITSILCIQQTDAKSLIAYSSVAHMGVATAALMEASSLGLTSILLMSIAHGFISPILFYTMNSLYEVVKSRSIYLMSGMKMISPMMTLILFFTLMLNSGVPPSLNFMSELLCLTSISSASLLLMAPILVLTSFSMVFSTLLYIKLSSMSPLPTTKLFIPKLKNFTTPMSLVPPSVIMFYFTLNF